MGLMPLQMWRRDWLADYFWLKGLFCKGRISASQLFPTAPAALPESMTGFGANQQAAALTLCALTALGACPRTSHLLEASPCTKIKRLDGTLINVDFKNHNIYSCLRIADNDIQLLAAYSMCRQTAILMPCAAWCAITQGCGLYARKIMITFPYRSTPAPADAHCRAS